MTPGLCVTTEARRPAGGLAARKNALRIRFLPLVGRPGVEEPAGVSLPRSCDSRAALARPDAPSAFTLVELLVVIAILAILVALAFPLVRNSIAAGDRAACVHNLKTLSAGVMLYAADNSGRIPAGNFGSDKSLPMFRLALPPYLPTGAANFKDEKYFHCRAALRARKVPFSQPTVTYGFNGQLGHQNASPPRLMLLTEIANPSKTMMIMDGRYALPTIWNFEVSPTKNRVLQPEDFVHGGKANVAYVDGHVATLGPDDLPDDKNDVFWNPKGVVP